MPGIADCGPLMADDGGGGGFALPSLVKLTRSMMLGTPNPEIRFSTNNCVSSDVSDSSESLVRAADTLDERPLDERLRRPAVMNVDHECWALVASFVPPDDRLELMALCKAVVDSPMRVAFLEQGAWRLPPTQRSADELLANETLKRRIKRVCIHEPWQEAYLSDLLVLEDVQICYPTEGIRFGFPPRAAGHITALSVKCPSVSLPSLNPLGAGLKTLDLRVDELRDAERMEPLSALTELTLQSVRRGSFPSFDNLPSLRALHVFDAEIRISALTPLVDLEELRVTSCSVQSLWVLGSVAHRLRVLELRDVAFNDPGTPNERSAVIASLVRVEQLKLEFMDFLDNGALVSLSQLVGLKELHLGFDFKDDLSPLAALTQLEQLSVIASPYADWSSIANMTKLRALTQNGSYNEWSASSARALQSLPALTRLWLPFKLMREYPLLHLKTLEVRPDWGQVARFDPGCCPNVQTLTISGRVDLHNLDRAFPRLKSLDLFVLTRCEDFRPLRSLTQLEHLTLPPDYGRDDDAAIYRGFTFLSGMTRMESLHMKYVPIDDLSVLRGMSRLRRLDLSRSRVEDLTVLAGLRHLRSLFLGGTIVKDVSCLRGHPSLRELHLPAGANPAPLKTETSFTLPNLVHLTQESSEP